MRGLLSAEWRRGVGAVAALEGRRVLRGRKLWLILLLCAAVPALLMVLGVLWEWRLVTALSLPVPIMCAILAQCSRWLLAGLYGLELLAVLLLVPGLAGSVFVGERERATFDGLALTRLTSPQLVLGKLFSVLLLPTLALLGVLPVTVIAFLLGGVGPQDLLWAVAAVFTSAVLVAAIGLWCSALFNLAWVAIGVSYGGAALVVGLLPGMYIINDVTRGESAPTFVAGTLLLVCIVTVMVVLVRLLIATYRAVKRLMTETERGKSAGISYRITGFWKGAFFTSVWVVMALELVMWAALLPMGGSLNDIAPGLWLWTFVGAIPIGVLAGVYVAGNKQQFLPAAPARVLMGAGGVCLASLLLFALVFTLDSRYAMEQAFYNFPEYFLVGNPLAALLQQFSVWGTIWPDWYNLAWTAHLFVPLTITIDLLAAILLLWATARKVEQLRRV